MKFISIASMFAFMTSIWVISTATSFNDRTMFAMFVAMVSLSVLVIMGITGCIKWSSGMFDNHFGDKDDNKSKRS